MQDLRLPTARDTRPPGALAERWRKLMRSLDKPWRHRLGSFATGLQRLFAPALVRLQAWPALYPRTQRRHNADLPDRLSITLTSHPPRFATLHLTLRSLLNQSLAADEVVLWLHAPDVALLPPAVLKLRARGLRIVPCKRDLRVYLKLIPALSSEPQTTWVSADDDVCYPRGWLACLAAAHRADPQAVICRRAHLMQFEADGRPAPYSAWQKETHLAGPDEALFLTGVGGVLYPPGSLHPDVTRADQFLALSPDADDIWLNRMARLQGTRIRRIGDTREPVIWLGSQRVSLFRRNRRGTGNDDCLARVAAAYGTGSLPHSPTASHSLT